MNKSIILSISLLLLSVTSFAECFNGGRSSNLSRNISSIKGALKSSKDIVCTQESNLGSGAKLYVVTLNQENQTAKLTRTGGDWGTPEDFGTSQVSIDRDNRGYVPVINVQSIDTFGKQTDELKLKITGSVGDATIRFDSIGRPTEFKNIKFKCDN